MAHVNPTVLKADGRYAAGIVQSNGHTVRGEYQYATYDEALAAAEEWYSKEIPKKPREK